MSGSQDNRPEPSGSLVELCETVIESASPRAKMAFGAAMWQLVRGADGETLPAAAAQIEKGFFPAGTAADALIRALGHCGGIVEGTDENGKPAWSLASPALMSEWPRLREFISSNSALLKTRSSMYEQARVWMAKGALADGLLPSGPHLDACRELMELMGNRLLPMEIAFIEASLAEEDRQLSKHLGHRIKKRLRPIVRFIRSHPTLCAFGVCLLVLSQVWSLLPLGALNDLLQKLRKDFSAPTQGKDLSLSDVLAQSRKPKVPKLKKPSLKTGSDGGEEPGAGKAGGSGGDDGGAGNSESNDPSKQERRRPPSAEELARAALERIDAARRARMEPEAAARKQLWESLSMGMDQGPVCTGSVSVECAAFSPSGGAVLTGDREGWLRAWSNSPEGPPRKLRETRSGLPAISFLRVSQDGTIAAIGPTGSFRLFDGLGQPKGPVSTPPGSGEPIASAAISANAGWLALASATGTILIARASDAAKTTRLIAESRSVSCLAISSDAAFLACGSEDGQVEIWDVREKLLNSALQVGSRVQALAFAADAGRLIAAGADGTIKNWKRESPSDKPKVATGVWAIRWASFDGPQGALLAVGETGLRVTNFDGSEQQPAMPLPESAESPMAVSRDGRWLVMAAKGGGPRVVAIGSPSRPSIEIAPGSAVRALAFNPAGDRLATALDDRTIVLWDMEGKPAAAALKGLAAPVERVTFTTSGANVVAIAERESKLYSWRLASSKLVTVSCDFAKAATAPVASRKVRLARGGRCVATLLPGDAVRVWEIKGKPICSLPVELPGGWIDLEFDPLARRLATVGYGGKPKVWDLTGRQVAACPESLASTAVVAWDATGARLAFAGARGGLVWDVPSGSVLGRWDDAADAIAFHPSEPLVATRSSGGRVQIRSMEGELAAPEIGAAGSSPAALPGALAFSPDGRLLAYVTQRRTVRFRECSLNDAVEEARRRLRRLEQSRP